MEDLKELQNICILTFLIVLICLLFEEFPVGGPVAGLLA
jgi:hypothetical protein